MQRIKYNESEILEAFYVKAEADGLLDRPSENLYPDFDISSPVKNEFVDIVAVASHDNTLYGLPGESGAEMVGKAHPGGGTAIKLDNNAPKDKDLANVETIIERQKAMHDVAKSKPTGKLVQAMTKLIALANLLDEQGEHVAAAELDAELAKIAADFPQATQMPVSSDTQMSADRAARIKANNGRVISMLNQLRGLKGLPPLAASVQAGVITKEVSDELANSIPNGYSTWRELFSKLDKLISDAKVVRAPSAGFASIPTPQVAYQSPAAPQKGPPAQLP
jgi:hypothetical protein